MRILIDDNSVVEKTADVLREGGLVMHPTETCYGLAVDVFNEDALRKLYEAKGMPADKPVSILVDGLEMAREFGVFSNKASELAEKYWPGALSILVPRTEKLPKFLNPGSEFVSMRISSMEFCRDIVSKLGRPVSTTSANKFGEPELYFAEDIEGVDLLVDAGEIEKNKPSTIVKVEGEEVTVLREGGVFIGA